MNILFSPLGKTDPIKYNHDGAMLHICRHFDIDKVYLYMSKEICDEEDRDGRFSYCLGKLGEHMNKSIAAEYIRREDLSDGVERFDFFTEEFAAILNGIHESMDEGDSLYLNISSGTPAMKATLQYLIPLTEYKVIPVQVTTPQKSSNEKYEERKDFDPALEWEYNEDKMTSESRCIESDLKGYAAKVQKKMIATLLEKYDYIGAWELAKTIRTNLSDKAFDLITAAKDRYMLSAENAGKIFKKHGMKVIIGTASGCSEELEYLLRSDLLVRKGEYADFIRSITPLLAKLYMYVLRTQCGLNVKRYCTGGKWDYIKVKENDKLNKVLSEGRDFTKLHYNNSNVLVTLITEFSDNDEIVSLCRKLRFVEEKVRNDVAHEIVYVSSEMITERTIDADIAPNGLAPKNIISIIIKVFSLCGVNMSREILSSYDNMNSDIMQWM